MRALVPERLALAAFCPEAELSLRVLDLPDGRVPARWERASSTAAAGKETGKG
jgi:hypothetical protein